MRMHNCVNSVFISKIHNNSPIANLMSIQYQFGEFTIKRVCCVSQCTFYYDAGDCLFVYLIIHKHVCQFIYDNRQSRARDLVTQYDNLYLVTQRYQVRSRRGPSFFKFLSNQHFFQSNSILWDEFLEKHQNRDFCIFTYYVTIT